MTILAKETFERFGFDPDVKRPASINRVVVRCDNCGAIYDVLYRALVQKTSPYCRKCPEYSAKRSQIASTSNKTRNIRAVAYGPHIDQVKDGALGFTELSRQLGLDNSTVAKWFLRRGIHSRNNTSIQQQDVRKNLVELYGESAIHDEVRYPGSRRKCDFYIDGVGYIEYDGSGFWHKFKKNDGDVACFAPIRLTAQAIYGGDCYLRWLLMGEKTGYCSALSPKEYIVADISDKRGESTRLLENCHPLGNSAGTRVFGLFYGERLIGVSKWGLPTNHADNGSLELRRFFVLDGTPRNTESWFLRKCELALSPNILISYVHSHERGSYLRACGWEVLPTKQKDYDCYVVGGKIYGKRTFWGWAKRIGLVKRYGTSEAKRLLAEMLGAEVITEPSKIKFRKVV